MQYNILDPLAINGAINPLPVKDHMPHDRQTWMDLACRVAEWRAFPGMIPAVRNLLPGYSVELVPAGVDRQQE